MLQIITEQKGYAPYVSMSDDTWGTRLVADCELMECLAPITMECLAPITAHKGAGAGMPWGRCDKAVADAGAAAVGGAFKASILWLYRNKPKLFGGLSLHLFQKSVRIHTR